MINISISGYKLIEKIHDSTRTIVYRGIREDDQKRAILKLLKAEYPTFAELVQLRNQYVIALNLDLPGVVTPLALENYRHGFALVMADDESISLKEYTGDNPLKIEEFFPIAIYLVNTLEGLYQNRVIHKDIKPHNILINPETQQVKLIDFSISSLLPRETTEIQNPNILEGTLAYISPEQTGRMNRGIDYRSDFYSLGVTWYELLTGQLPFESKDPMELVHCHIAKQPTPLHEIAPDIPKTLSLVVMKLMAKTAEDRYQSARGIRHDLEICWQQWQQQGSITAFTLGTHDRSDRFIIPEKLYGREREVETLLAAFDRISEGRTEMMLVAGFSGIGKTAVVNEVHKPIVRQRGYFIKGKFDQFQRNVPFVALVQAFSNLMGQLLTESAAKLQEWQNKIIIALGENAQVIIDVIPELERVIGKQPPVPELSGSAAQNRFNLLFGKFMQVFATQEHPLVIFLDDLQWADSASLKLMQLLMSARDSPYLLLIGAYRDNEVSPAHPLMLTLDEIGKTEATVNQITLAPLGINALNRLVADSFICPPELALPLTELVYQKTKGNPFFSNQFLKSLYEEGLIIFNADAGYWQCDMTGVKELSLTDDVVEFMARQLQKMPSSTQNVLELAACIGNQFDLETLAIVSSKSQGETAASLWKALQEGLIIPISQTYKFFQSAEEGAEGSENLSVEYKFLHDRVQQAAYSLIPEEEKKTTHLQIGQLLLRNIPETQREEKIFDLVNQLNYGVELITQPIEREQLARFNLAAGTKAKAATAYSAAVGYFAIGRELLVIDCWQSQYELTLALYESAAEATYLNGQYGEMEALVSVVLERARTLLHKVKAYEVQIQAKIAHNQMLSAVQTAREVLKLLDVTFPDAPEFADIENALQETGSNLAGTTISELIELPEMTDRNVLAAMQLSNSIFGAAYLAVPTLMPLIVFKQVNLSVKYGNTSVSAFAYVNYGLLLCALVGDLDAGWEFGKLSLKVLSNLNAKNFQARVMANFNIFVRHWKEHLHSTLTPLLEAYSCGLETGDLEFAAYSAYNYCRNLYLSGQPLSDVKKELLNYNSALVQIKQETTLNYGKICLQVVCNLIDKVADFSQITGEVYEEQAMLPMHQQGNDRYALFCLSFHKLIGCYLFRQYDRAVTQGDLAESCLDGATGMPDVAVFYFYDSLARLAVSDLAAVSEQKEFLRKVEGNQEKMQKWAHHAPMNHLHKFHLVAAERHRVLGEKMEAMEMFDRAIAGAQENGYVQEEALANELAGKFYLEWGKETIAEAYLKKAYYCYARWGAKAKVEDLEKRYPQYLVPILNLEETSLTTRETISRLTAGTVTSTSTSGISAVLELETVMKAGQAISGEIQLDKLLAILMQVVMENGGASKGALILPSGENLMLAVSCVNNQACKIFSPTVVSSSEVPLSLLNYVQRTMETVVIKDASKETTWAGDPYMIEHEPKSVLCTPIIRQGKTIGILYLENNLVTGAFTPDRVEVLNILCAQAAISLENAQLYQQSQDYAYKLEQSLQQLQEMQLQLVQGEKMASLGQLAAGVAHEINNPVSFIAGNINHAREYVRDLINLIDLYQEHYPQPLPEISEEIEAIDLEYLVKDLPELISSMETGTNRITQISHSMRTFSRADTVSKVLFNIHDGLDSTLMILSHRLKANPNRPEIQIVKNYGELPEIPCYPGQLNQVFMNLMANAIDALEEYNQGRSYSEIKDNPNQITISTEILENSQDIAIGIKDNGPGMSEEVQRKVFEHLFTTKPPGKGTGLGLSISRQIVEDKHGGKLKCSSQVGVGTEFVIEIPLGGDR